VLCATSYQTSIITLTTTTATTIIIIINNHSSGSSSSSSRSASSSEVTAKISEPYLFDVTRMLPGAGVLSGSR
jgi:hypothetical protein